MSRFLSIFACLASFLCSHTVVSATELMPDGELVYKRTCTSCHGFDGEGRAGLGTSLSDSAMIREDREALLDMVLNGSPNTLMIAFKDNLQDDELAAVINYLLQRFGDGTGTPVMPTEVAAAR